MKRICEFCRKEYEWEEGQLNWGKNGLKHGKGSVDCKKYCCYNCGKKAYKQHCQETNLKRYGVMNTFQVPEFKEKAAKMCVGSRITFNSYFIIYFLFYIILIHK